jgi:hypothetical protein
MPATKAMPQGFTTINTAARTLGCAPSKLCTYALQGVVKPLVSPGGTVFIETASVEALARSLGRELSPLKST